MLIRIHSHDCPKTTEMKNCCLLRVSCLTSGNNLIFVFIIALTKLRLDYMQKSGLVDNTDDVLIISRLYIRAQNTDNHA